MVNNPQVPAGQPFTPNVVHLERRLFHMAGSSICPVLALFVQRDLVVTLLLGATVLFVVGDVVRLLVGRLNRLFHRLFRQLLRKAEESRITGASYMLLGTVGAFVLFSKDVAILAVFFAALGDPIAAMIGIRVPGKRVFGKSLLGTMAMIAVALGVAGILHVTAGIGVRWPVVVGAMVAGIVELLPLPLDDNLRVPIVAGTAMTFLGM